ncbi:TusE/DsrC/DsvC family sulfur relay protein [Succinivibrio dextrinosolvens]|uniref:TusE/DsrC/DsvC family sulfur relay protein n=1 Tax=Succinivibrio dextrinosolvens TaxID=83771 RepID=UPI0004E1D775|nr:TusE/DsrC/DsvC family sulfur relay protein [Succinivibrio dextrinosolvens]MBE6422752.1 TusE/DsrC/DsvC family sulfur relay protein [Succinivibrio dextrinosolvens]MBQ3678129.1 TusE/DsrC/DsvC family sulfur relay protein [Succinivibrio sp.]
MSFTFNGREILTDSEGYLKNAEDWDESLMRFMAKNDGLDLTDDHILIIKAVKNYFEEYATTPAIRILIKYLKTSGHEELASSIRLAVLFPDGAAKSAAKYAGLPKPVKCI